MNQHIDPVVAEMARAQYEYDQREQRRREAALRRLIAELASVCAANEWRNAALDLEQRAREASENISSSYSLQTERDYGIVSMEYQD